MKKEPFIQIPKELLDHPIIDRLVDKEGAMFLGTYAVLLLYLSRRPNCVGSLNNLTLRLIAMQLHKSVKYVRHVIFDTGLFRADEERNAFTSPNLQRTFGIPETLDNGAEALGGASQTPRDEPKEDSTDSQEDHLADGKKAPEEVKDVSTGGDERPVGKDEDSSTNKTVAPTSEKGALVKAEEIPIHVGKSLVGKEQVPSEKAKSSSAGADLFTAKEKVPTDETKHPTESEDRSGGPGQCSADWSDGLALAEAYFAAMGDHLIVEEDHPQDVDGHPTVERDHPTAEEVHPSDRVDHPIIESENPKCAEEGPECPEECFATARKPLANAMEIHLGMNHDASVIDSKLNANSIFVRVPYIRARINRDKDKNINLRKKESTSSTQKKNAVVVADEFFNFGFYSFKPTKVGARGGGAGGHVDKGSVTLPTENAKGSEGRDRSPPGPSPPGCRRSSPALRKVIG